MELGQHTCNGCTPKGRAMTRTAGAVVAGETGGVEGSRVGTLEGICGTEQEVTYQDCPSSTDQALKGPLSLCKLEFFV